MIAICLRGYNALTPVLVLMKYIYLVPLDTLTLTSVRPAHQDIKGNWYLVVVSREGILVSCVLSRRSESEFSQRVIFAFWVGNQEIGVLVILHKFSGHPVVSTSHVACLPFWNHQS